MGNCKSPRGGERDTQSPGQDLWQDWGTPQKRLEPEAGKGCGTRDWSTLFQVWTEKKLKLLPSFKINVLLLLLFILRMRAVITSAKNWMNYEIQFIPQQGAEYSFILEQTRSHEWFLH